MDIIQSISKFLKESRAEIKKVNWLARPQLISYTLMVLGFMLATGVFLGSLDWGFAFLLENLFWARNENFRGAIVFVFKIRFKLWQNNK